MAVILVVDDEVTISALLQDALADAGHEVFIAGNGSEGMAHLKISCPDVVVSDYMMPELDGIAFLEALREHSSCRHVPFILMSGLPPISVNSLAPACSAFLKKPFTLSEAVKLVADVLRPDLH